MMKINPRLIVIEGLSGSGKSTQAKRLVERLEGEHAPAFYNTEPTKKNPMPFGKVIRQIIEGKTLDQESISICIDTVMRLRAQLVVCNDGTWDMYMDRNRVEKLFIGIAEKLYQMDQCGDRANLLSALELQILYLMDRRFDLIYTIEPKTAQGYRVVQDRYELSTFSYGGSRSLFIDDMWNLQALITGEHYRVPVLTVVFKVNPETAAARLQSSGKVLDQFEKTLESLQTIDRCYDSAIEFLRKKHQTIAVENVGTWHGITTIDANRPEDEVFEELWRLVSGIFLK